MPTCSTRHEISIHHHIFVLVDRPVGGDVSVQVVVAGYQVILDQLGCGSYQLYIMADNPLEDAFFGKGPLEKCRCWGQLHDILGVA